MKHKILLFLLAAGLAGCAQPEPTAPDRILPATSDAIISATLDPTIPATSLPTSPAITETPTPSPAPAVTCADLDAAWGDWPRAIHVINELIASGQACGPEPLASKLYAATFNYAMFLEQRGNREDAIAQYQTAFALNPRRDEALLALARLGSLPSPTPTACDSATPPNADPAPDDAPDPALFVATDGDQFVLDDAPITLQGVNYYPRHAAWYAFLTQADRSEMAEELDLIQQAGFNTIRIFLWYDALFTCAPEQAIPDEAGFSRVDTLLDLARARNLRVIITLNDLPDLYFRPLYTDFARYDAQTVFIVRRYRNDPTILAWDIRNEGDLDYGANGRAPRATREQVLAWLAHASALVEENDPNHLTTSGWWGDPIETAPYVDFLSFHHWGTAQSLWERIADYRTRTGKPLLLEEVGYHSWEGSPQSPRDEAMQAESLRAAVTAAEETGIGGWLVWTAFDFSPPPDQIEHYEHHFGLWTLDLIPKPALSVLPLP